MLEVTVKLFWQKKTEENKIIIHQNSKIYFIRTEVTKISSVIKLYKNTVSSSYIKLITEILQKITEILQKFRYQRSNWRWKFWESLELLWQKRFKFWSNDVAGTLFHQDEWKRNCKKKLNLKLFKSCSTNLFWILSEDNF